MGHKQMHKTLAQHTPMSARPCGAVAYSTHGAVKEHAVPNQTEKSPNKAQLFASLWYEYTRNQQMVYL